jgi:hypothetical protein
MTLEQLTTRLSGRDRTAARDIAIECRSDPALLADVVHGATATETSTAAACAGILATVAESDPKLVAPYGEQLVLLLSHKRNAVRWQAMQAVAAVAALRPELIEPLLPRLMATVEADTSIIARDKATEAIAAYAGTSPAAARQAVPSLMQALTIANGRFASRALDGLRNAVTADSDLAESLLPVAGTYVKHHRGVARTAAKRLLRALASILASPG